ncbi:MAG: DUF4340 domain-containing protein [Pseudomonadota bacterium]|nr:DUF4340 domain-containing protein [Pseudomonadota bacterium]
MNKSVIVFAGLLVLSLGAAWQRYTGGEETPKEGVVLIDAKAAELEKVVYTSPELTITFEQRTDDFGRYGWVTVEDRKKKGKDAAADAAPVEPKVTRFKTGIAADKVVEAFTPMVGLRKLENVDDAQLTSFGLSAPDTTVAVSAGGKTTVFELGGETYGTKDRYAKNQGDGKVYVIDDEPFKTLKFAATRLPERGLSTSKVEQIDGLSLGVGATNASWTQKNKDDKAAAYWEREGGTGKDETFGNWIDKALKLKSTAYVQDGEAPADLVPGFDLTVRAAGQKPETIQLLQGGDDWYARSESTRGLVKLSRGPAKDAVEDAKDVVEGKEPPPDEPAAPGSAAAGMPPGMGGPGGGPGMGGPPHGGPHGGPPSLLPPGRPSAPPGGTPTPAPK